MVETGSIPIPYCIGSRLNRQIGLRAGYVISFLKSGRTLQRPAISVDHANRCGNTATAIGIFLLSFAAFAWLAPQSPTNWQVVTRLGLTLTIVESEQLSIDNFAERTRDKALADGHFYADKAPGLSFLAIPAVAAAALVMKATGHTSDEPEDFARFAKIASIAVNGLISAFATAALFLTAIRLGATRTGALFAAGTLAFATPLGTFVLAPIAVCCRSLRFWCWSRSVCT